MTQISVPAEALECPSASAWVKEDVILKRWGISKSTAKKLRYSGQWQQGVHCIKLGWRSIRYNAVLIDDWFINRSNPQAHQRAVTNYLLSLPSNQRRPGRPRKGEV